jgi:hypothetical protein
MNPVHTSQSYFSQIHFNIILSPMSTSSYCSISIWLSYKSYICIPLSYNACHIPYQSYSLWIYYSEYIRLRIQVTKLLILSSPTPYYLIFLKSNIVFRAVFWNTPSIASSLIVRDQVSHPLGHKSWCWNCWGRTSDALQHWAAVKVSLNVNCGASGDSGV